VLTTGFLEPEWETTLVGHPAELRHEAYAHIKNQKLAYAAGRKQADEVPAM
jgi:hypothetical protein